jgi:hypothetical protein
MTVQVKKYEKISKKLLKNKKFWEKLIAYFPFTVTSVG